MPLVARRFRTAKPVSAPFGFSGSPSRRCGGPGSRGCSRRSDPLRGRLDSGHVPAPRRRQDARFGSERCSTASTRRRRPMNDDDSCRQRDRRTPTVARWPLFVRVVGVEPGGGRCSKEQVVEDEELVRRGSVLRHAGAGSRHRPLLALRDASDRRDNNCANCFTLSTCYSRSCLSEHWTECSAAAACSSDCS